MAIYRETVSWVDRFDRAQAITTTPGQNGWTLDDVSVAGAPTALVASADGGHLALTLAADSEVESLCAFHNDVLNFDLADIQYVRIVAKVAAVASLSVVTFGVGSARNDDEDAMATNAWFKMEGAASTTAVVAETDDGTNNNDDVATGETLAAVYKEFVIDFSYGLPDVRFYIDGGRVASATTFDMSDLTAGLNVQPFVQVSKASSTNVAAIHVARFEIQYASSYGA